jgi:hypothetical protein
MKKTLLTICLLVFLTPIFCQADITSNLQAWYKFDEGSGTTANDSSSNSNTGTITGGTYTTGKIGPYALALSGSSQYVTVPHNSSIAITGDITIAGWIYVTDYSNYNGIVGKTSGAFPKPYDFYLVQTTGIPRFYRGNGSSANFVDGTSAPGTGAWHHIAVTMSGTTVTHYLDGVANGSNTLSTPIADSGGSLYIGSRADLVTMFKGNMDDIRIYNRALSSSDITQLYIYTGITTAFSRFQVSLSQFIIHLGSKFIVY